mmetsp:Transcript_60312/g.197315  ORF Transcript_60312/g.197315 Transcript_60312/m.197315 type:complete len:711 (-) Transcript_60312:1633-3765(-)
MGRGLQNHGLQHDDRHTQPHGSEKQGNFVHPEEVEINRDEDEHLYEPQPIAFYFPLIRHRGPEQALQTDRSAFLLEAGHRKLQGLLIGLVGSRNEEVHDPNHKDEDGHDQDGNALDGRWRRVIPFFAEGQHHIDAISVADQQEAHRVHEDLPCARATGSQGQESVQETEEAENGHAEDATHRDGRLQNRQQLLPDGGEGPTSDHELHPARQHDSCHELLVGMEPNHRHPFCAVCVVGQDNQGEQQDDGQHVEEVPQGDPVCEEPQEGVLAAKLPVYHQPKEAPDLQDLIENFPQDRGEQETPAQTCLELVFRRVQHPPRQNSDLKTAVDEVRVVEMRHTFLPHDIDDGPRGDLREDVQVPGVLENDKNLRAEHAAYLQDLHIHARGRLPALGGLQPVVTGPKVDLVYLLQDLRNAPTETALLDCPLHHLARVSEHGAPALVPARLRRQASVGVAVPFWRRVLVRRVILPQPDVLVMRPQQLVLPNHRVLRKWVVRLVRLFGSDREGLQQVFAGLRSDAHELPPLLAELGHVRSLRGQRRPPGDVHRRAAVVVGVPHELGGGRRRLLGHGDEVLDALLGQEMHLADGEVALVDGQLKGRKVAFLDPQRQVGLPLNQNLHHLIRAPLRSDVQRGVRVEIPFIDVGPALNQGPARFHLLEERRLVQGRVVVALHQMMQWVQGHRGRSVVFAWCRPIEDTRVPEALFCGCGRLR